MSASADLIACRALLRGGSRSFYAASFVLPKRVRDPACGLYAFCRLADDAIDDAIKNATSSGNDSDHAGVLARLRQRLDGAYTGAPWPLPADRAFAAVVNQFAIPRALPEALLQGFAWDALGRDYDSLSALYDYCARVAGTVGVMMALLMDVRDPERLARACDLGVAMQLSNIARDVGEDARAGRIYLPLSWLREAGIDPQAWLQRPLFSAALGAIIERLLEVAEGLYQRAEYGIAELPGDCQPGIFAARLLYAEIGREVARRGFDSVSQRAVAPGSRKLWRLTQALALQPKKRPARGATLAPLPETRFLIDAVEPRATVVAAKRRSFDARMAWLVDFLQQLEQREQNRQRGEAR